jgi:hypothetical protein
VSDHAKELRRLIDYAQSRGWVVVRDRRHVVLRHPAHGTVVVSRTPSSARAVTAARSSLRLDDESTR